MTAEPPTDDDRLTRWTRNERGSVIGRIGAAVAVVALVLGVASDPLGATSCAPPWIAWERGGEPTLSPHLVRPGESVTVYGYGWRHDELERGLGCTTVSDSGGCGTGAPIEDITLVLRGPLTDEQRDLYRREAITRGARSAALGTTDADDNGRFVMTFDVPNVPPGEYWVDLGPYGQPAVMRVQSHGD